MPAIGARTVSASTDRWAASSAIRACVRCAVVSEARAVETLPTPVLIAVTADWTWAFATAYCRSARATEASAAFFRVGSGTWSAACRAAVNAAVADRSAWPWLAERSTASGAAGPACRAAYWVLACTSRVWASGAEIRASTAPTATRSPSETATVASVPVPVAVTVLTARG